MNTRIWDTPDFLDIDRSTTVQKMAVAQPTRMKLYWYPKYRSVRIIWLIKEMGVEEDFELIKYKPNDNCADDTAYRKDVHPLGTVPTLVVPGRPPLLESGAICMYLADIYDKLVPDVKDRADYYDFIMFGNATLDELLEFYYVYWVDKLETEEREKTMRAKLNTCLDYLSTRLQDREFLCGDRFTAADCVLVYSLYYIEYMSKDKELYTKHPKVHDYLSRMRSRPAFLETVNMT